ncbi:MAG: transglutaminase-like domain-containing protein [Tannerellaceae bacterium]|nr:transglutaminase-like domain-containing protein [Tannerellaceae bacterium]
MFVAAGLLGLLTVITGGCVGSGEHFVTNRDVRERIGDDFAAKCATLAQGDLFAVFNEDITLAEREALTFLYAYMPLGDVTDYPGDFYLRNIRASFRTREEMPWGKDIPEDIFRHFVLPIRVNNENMDDSRTVFYDELKDRVKGLSLYEAVLEVNHWCHEKVIYTPSDSRTSSPLASVKTAYGRCGEESVFTVAALRSVGIPARQVYTPRWAHTDDNHAWVEAWVEGRWRFMGACEPEPVLDMAWFNGPAYRGMLMHTKVFGRYNGPEETMEETACYTEINVIDNYAPTARLAVTVTDSLGMPAGGATVEFKIYNYAEFYTVSRKVTDGRGEVFLSAGLGDMLVWASRDGLFGFAKASYGKDEAITIRLDRHQGDIIETPLDITPPIDGAIPVEATEEQRMDNALRLSEEDRLRNQYVSTFFTTDQAAALAGRLGMDEARTAHLLTASRGNYKEIEAFLEQADNKTTALALLESISVKDLRDTPASVLADHLQNTPGDNRDSRFAPYILNPRIANELLSPYKSFFASAVPRDLKDAVREDPQALAVWVAANITLSGDLNPQRIPVMPSGVWRARVADSHSRDIFFVALARSLGLAARIEQVAGKVQYFHNNWIDVDFEAPRPVVTREGRLVASYTPLSTLPDPKYYSHFTIARIRPDGTLHTLNFESEAQVDMGLGDSWSRLLKQPLAIDEGHYIMVTGTRMARGNVLAKILSFDVAPGQTTEIDLTMREDTADIQVIGSIDAEALYELPGGGDRTSILQSTGRGYFVIAILGAREEPTNHAMRDIAASSAAFEAWGRPMLLLFPDRKGLESFDKGEFGALPNTITYGVDAGHSIAAMLTAAVNLPGRQTLPIFVIADTFGRVVFVSHGYTIGIGERMLQTIHKL